MGRITEIITLAKKQRRKKTLIMETLNSTNLFDSDCEKKVLAALISDNNLLYEVPDLSPDDFYSKMHQRIFAIISELVGDGQEADIIRITEFTLKNPDKDNPRADEIADIYGLSTCADVTLKANVMRLKELSQRRLILLTGYTLQAVGSDESRPIEEADSAIDSLKKQTDNAKGTTTIAETLSELSKTIEDNAAGRTQGTVTGFDVLDVNGGGLHPNTLAIIAAETSQGKTALAVSMALNMARHGVPVIFYSMEMTGKELTARMVAITARISSRSVMYSPLTEDEKQRFHEAAKTVGALPVYFDDASTTTIEKIISSIRANVRKNHIKVAIVDYLQILNSVQRVQNAEQFMGDVARRLKNTAKELGICIIALSQLARDRDNPEPALSRLRASGQIAEAADVVLLLYRPTEYGKQYRDYPHVDVNGTAELIIGKGRNIGTGNSIIGFEKEFTRFYELHGRTPEREVLEDDDDRPF